MLRLFSLILFSVCASAQAQTIPGEVITVHDGNTIELLARDLQTFKVVLAGIDCPELGQPYGVEAKQFVTKTILRQKVVLHLQGKDRYKNYIGVVVSNDSMDIRLALLREGFAWTQERDPHPELEQMRKESARQSKGLWREDSPVAPWIYRRQQSMLQAKSR